MNSNPPTGITPQADHTADYQRFANLVHERYGLHFSATRRLELERGVCQAFAASTCANLDEYYSLLHDSQSGAIHLEQLLNALTVNESHFFRNAPQFEALRQYILPEIIERRRAVRNLRVWSAGCANGEEPYSIAMLLRELLPDADRWSITILGSDINTEALERARRAIYGEWAFREERAKEWRSRYFTAQNKRYELLPEIRQMVTFNTLNLAGNSYPAYETNTMFFDLILCCNVMIYFSSAVTQAVVNRFYEAMVEGGWLAVGHAEHSLNTFKRFSVHNFSDATLYQRSNQPANFAQDWSQPITQTGQPISPARQPAPPAASQTPRQASQPKIHSHARQTAEPGSGATSWFEQASEQIEYGHLEKGRDLLLKGLEQEARHAPACALLGQVYADMGHWEQAETWCQQAIQIDSLYLPAYYTLGLVLQHQGYLERAIEMMKKVIYIDRQHTLAHYNLADLYYRSQQIPQALKSLDNAWRSLKDYPEDKLLAGSSGITVERLRQAIIRQQQQWRLRNHAQA